MSYNRRFKGFIVNISQSAGLDGFRQDAQIWTNKGWEPGSTLALDSETLEREVYQKVDELIHKGISPGPSAEELLRPLK